MQHPPRSDQRMMSCFATHGVFVNTKSEGWRPCRRPAGNVTWEDSTGRTPDGTAGTSAGGGSSVASTSGDSGDEGDSKQEKKPDNTTLIVSALPANAPHNHSLPQ